MATMNIKTMKELIDTTAAPTGNNLQTFYPKTHEKAVVDDNGNTLDSKLADIIEDAEDAATAAANVVKAQCEEIKAQTEAIKTQTEAVLDNGAVRTDVAQSLSDAEKAQALANVGISGIDNEPTAGSENLVKSGGIKNELALGAIYDVSAKNPTAGPNSDGKFASLSALLSDANLNTLIPTAVRKGGMSIKFIQSSDNNCVQFRYMLPYENTTAGNTAFANTANWQGVDKVISEGSSNLVTSNGVLKLLSDCLENIDYVKKDYAVLANGKFSTTVTDKHSSTKVSAGEVYIINNKSTFQANTRFAFATNDNTVSGGDIPLVDGTNVIVVPANSSNVVTIPNGCEYLLVNYGSTSPFSVKSLNSVNALNLQLNGSSTQIFNKQDITVTSGVALDTTLYANLAKDSIIIVKVHLDHGNEITQWRLKYQTSGDNLYSDYINKFDEDVTFIVPENITGLKFSVRSTYSVNNGSIDVIGKLVTVTGLDYELHKDIDDINTEINEINTAISGKQDTLVAGDNMDATPTENSTKPITSGGVYSAVKQTSDTIESELNKWTEYKGQINSTGIFKTTTGSKRFTVLSVVEGDSVTIRANGIKNTQYAFLSSFAGQPTENASGNVVGATGYSGVAINTETTVTVPVGASYLYVYITDGAQSFKPVKVTVNGKSRMPLQDQIDYKQDILTFDNKPTKDSINPVASGGLFNLLEPEAILPDYVVTAAKDAYNRLQTWADGDDVFTLAQITDTHFDTYIGVHNEIKYLSRLSDIFNFDALVHSGDITLFHADTLAEIRSLEYLCVKGMDSKAPFFLSHGNHDGNPNVTMELSEIGNIFNLPLAKKGHNVTFGSSDKCYGYLDFDYAKVRVFFLDTTEDADGGGFSFATPQAQWFADNLATVPSDYHVIVCSHICPYTPIKNSVSQTSASYLALLEGFVAKSRGTSGSVSWDFTGVSNNSKLAFCLFGHEHFNNYGKNNGVNYIIRQGYNNGNDHSNVQDITNWSCDVWGVNQPYGTACLFDIVAIKVNGTGKVIRIGVGGSTRDFEFTF